MFPKPLQMKHPCSILAQMNKEALHPKFWLEREFTARRKRNKSFSLRAFSKLIDLPPGRVSQVLSEKRAITPTMGKKIAERLKFDPKETEKFLNAIALGRKSRKSDIQAEEKFSAATQNYQILNQDQFQSISEPLHFDLMALMETKNFVSDVKWMAKRLATSVVEVRGALDRLQRLGFVKIDNEKFILSVNTGIKVDTTKSTAAVSLARKQVMQHAMQCLEEIDAAFCDISSMTMAIDFSLLPQARDTIMDFRRSLTKFLESGTKNQVYRLNIQLVPVSVIDERPPTAN
jgi:uncharacterized protein (TIGR02147 family)